MAQTTKLDVFQDSFGVGEILLKNINGQVYTWKGVNSVSIGYNRSTVKLDGKQVFALDEVVSSIEATGTINLTENKMSDFGGLMYGSTLTKSDANGILAKIKEKVTVGTATSGVCSGTVANSTTYVGDWGVTCLEDAKISGGNFAYIKGSQLLFCGKVKSAPSTVAAGTYYVSDAGVYYFNEDLAGVSVGISYTYTGSSESLIVENVDAGYSDSNYMLYKFRTGKSYIDDNGDVIYDIQHHVLTAPCVTITGFPILNQSNKQFEVKDIPISLVPSYSDLLFRVDSVVATEWSVVEK